MSCAETQRLLSAHVDGELDAPSAAAVEAHLRDCPRCRAAGASLVAVRAAVTRACERASAPSRLRAAIFGGLRTPAAPPPLRWHWAAAAPGLAALLLALWIVLAQPWQTPVAPAADGTRVVYHIAGSENIGAVLRTLKNHLDATPGVRVVVVAHNNGIEFLLDGARDETGRPYAQIVRDFHERGVEFRVCTNSLTRRQIDPRAVLPDAVLVPSGIAEISRLQGREGYTYLRL